MARSGSLSRSHSLMRTANADRRYVDLLMFLPNGFPLDTKSPDMTNKVLRKTSQQGPKWQADVNSNQVQLAPLRFIP